MSTESQQTTVIISMGSNRHQSVNMHWGTERLESLLTDCRMSRRLWTMDIKNTGCWYMNQLLKATTDMTHEELEKTLKAIEQEAFRTRHDVTLDLDIILYGSERYHEKDWPRPYIQRLLPDIE